MKLLAQVSGAPIQEIKDEDIETVKELRKHLKLDKTYTATVDGEPEDDSYEFPESGSVFVAFAPAVKGGRS